MTEAIEPPKKGRWLNWVLAVPLGLLHLMNTVCVYAVLRYPPQGEWDHQGYAGTATFCLFSICLSVITVLITLIPPVRRAMGPWWLAPPVILGVISWVRIATLE
ncbi:hypothetical protein [Streptomyces sp. NPDC059533]|uniref:hypothetical protein n=1 Tax=unclassified Streptomyces TaxID=2593676 RepID=UPI0036A9AE4B